ncbi:MAG: MBL fold metallo-hydrolase, partial [Verrucomicrobiota bacterium]
MKLHFCGGADTVTGSQHIVEANGHKVLRDCGLFQGRRRDAREINRNLLFDPRTIHAMLLSHAHIDHSGNIPSLNRHQPEFPIYATSATSQLCRIMLPDSARIQEQEAFYLNRKKSRKGLDPVKPLYTNEDAEAMLETFKDVDYHETFEPAPGIEARSYEAGHILGSALTRFTVRENGTTRHVGFVVDLGRRDLPIIRDPEIMEDLDVLVMESTYGNRTHVEADNAEQQLKEIIDKTYDRGGKVIIPSFALERAQELLFHLCSLISSGNIPRMPIYVDSPMATRVSRVFMKNQEFTDREFQELRDQIGSVMGAKWV